MSLTWDALFGLETIMTAVQLHADQSRNMRLTRLFDTGADSDFAGETASWDELQYPRDLAALVARDAPAKARKPMDRVKRYAGLVTFKEKEFIPADEIAHMRAVGADATVRESAPARVQRVIRGLTNRIGLSIEKLAAQALHGKVQANQTNFPESEVSYADITYAVQTFTSPSGWNNAATKILSDANELPAIKALMEDNAGLPIGRAIFNRGVGTYLLANTEIQAWAQGTIPGVQILEAGQLQRLGGVPRWEEYNGGHRDSGGTHVKYIQDNKVIFLPDDESAPELVMARGFGTVPARSGAITAASPEQAESIMPRRAPSAGWFGYAYINPDPVGVWVVVGWRGFPIIRNPLALVVATVA